MRIIAGIAKGRRLKCPGGLRTRPTPDRVRESVFSIIGQQLSGSRVLDLYAGTGAIGLEAMSRGADGVVFVEKDPLVLGVLRDNIAACGFEGKATIIRSPVLPFLRKGDLDGSFDLVFADPPYGGDKATLTLMALSKRAKSLQGCLIVMEHSPGDIVTPPAAMRVVENRKYGNTELTFLHLPGGEEA